MPCLALLCLPLLCFAVLCLAMAMVVEEMVEEPEPAISDMDGFELPFKVATLGDLQQRAYINSAGSAEWLFSRAHAFCQIGTDPGRLLRLNKANIEMELNRLQVPPAEFHYRGKEQEVVAEGAGPQQNQWKDHTFESKALLVALLWLVKNRALKAISKAKSLHLILELVTKAFTAADVSQPLMALVTKKNGPTTSREIAFSPQGICHAWGHSCKCALEL